MNPNPKKTVCLYCGHEFSPKDGIPVFTPEREYVAYPECGRTKRSRYFDKNEV